MNLNIIESKPEVKSVAIITPTVGNVNLQQCVASVLMQQTNINITHHVVIDGPQHIDPVVDMLTKVGSPHTKMTCLPENVGKAFGQSWYGHRIYAGFSYLVNEDAIIYLDEDNWLEYDHVEKLVQILNERQTDWSFSYRKIFDKDGNYLTDDNCESLGVHPVWTNDQVFHIDTSSYCVRRDVAVRVCGGWYGQWGADRQFFSLLAEHFPNALPSQSHSLCYRLDGNPNSVKKEFFDSGNAEMHKRYGDKLPWMLPLKTV